MSVIAAALKHMLAAGLPHDQIIAAVGEMEVELCREETPEARKKRLAAARAAAYRDRKADAASRKSVTISRSSVTAASVTKRDEITLERDEITSLACVRDKPLTLGVTGEDLFSLRSNKHAGAKSVTLAKPNGFARFWEAYPRKVGKGAAELEYGKAVKLIGGPDPPGVLLAALERVKLAWRGKDPDFIPHPRTWLHQTRWEDEPEQPAHEPIDPKFAATQAKLARSLEGFELSADIRRARSGFR